MLTGRGQLGKWVVTKDDGSPERGNVLAQPDADPTDCRFPICTYDALTAKDSDIALYSSRSRDALTRAPESFRAWCRCGLFRMQHSRERWE